jgi:hypothetical protein
MRTSLYRNQVALLFSLASFLPAAAMAQLSTQTATQTTQTATQATADWIGKLPLATAEGAAALVQDPDDYTGGDFQVKPLTFDPFKTYLVQSTWLTGTGCPTNAKIVVFNAMGNLEERTTTDTACPTNDQKDSRVEGLLLAKTGPTANVAAAFARIVGVKGKVLTELGWDIRKAGGNTFTANGSHCGNGAPRWNIELQDGRFFFLGCNSPVADQITPGEAWIRQRWGVNAPLSAFNASTGILEVISGQVIKSLSIAFDEGSDTGPDFFGAAILDNIDINGGLVGRGATVAN